ncbi:hypothetical protein LJC59_08640 [Desulfovibrio sp. OttesenSCG-928-A18]|nr:hypothetical protein [Desulfovibrio sp. OttesenSCG-928-A18]
MTQHSAAPSRGLDNLGFITVNDNRYPIDKLNPLEAIAFGNRVMAVVGPLLRAMLDASMQKSCLSRFFDGLFTNYPSELWTGIMNDALRRCYTPHNEPLHNQAIFNEWFRRYPGDLFELGLMGVYSLAADFFPRPLAIQASNLVRLIQAAMGKASLFQTDGCTVPGPDA